MHASATLALIVWLYVVIKPTLASSTLHIHDLLASNNNIFCFKINNEDIRNVAVHEQSASY